MRALAVVAALVAISLPLCGNATLSEGNCHSLIEPAGLNISFGQNAESGENHFLAMLRHTQLSFLENVVVLNPSYNKNWRLCTT